MRNPDHSSHGMLDERFRDYLSGRLQSKPPTGRIDPEKTSDDYLKSHFLPSRPDRDLRPKLYRFWRETLQIPTSWAKVTVRKTRVLALARGHRRGGPLGEQSVNWSGAVARTFDYSHLTSVQGRWTVPSITLEPGTTEDTMCSMWIGFDGSDPGSRSLPQIGTAHAFDVLIGKPHGPRTDVWWEWFRRDAETNAYFTLPVLAAPGDQMRAILTRIDATTVNFFIANETTRVAAPFQFTLDGLPADALANRVEANTAEWVLERPRRPGRRNAPLFAMPNFKHAAFDHCLAGTDSAITPELDLTKAKLLHLVDWRPAPPGSRTLSTAKRIGSHELKFKNG